MILAALAALGCTPIIFYVSSRYRLPLAALLVVPAGVGVDWIVEKGRKGWRPFLIATTLPVALGVASWWWPVAGLDTATLAGALANRAGAWHKAGNTTNATRDIAEAMAMDRNSSPIWFQQGIISEGGGDLDEAVEAYGVALNLAPLNPDVAGNLAGVLIRTGRSAQAAGILGPVIVKSPWHRVCQVNRVVALAGSGEMAMARKAAQQATRAGIDLPPALLGAIGMEEHDKEELGNGR